MGEGRWYYDPSRAAWHMVIPEAIPSGVELEPVHTIDSRDIRTLLAALDDQGWIKPRLDDVIRQDDVKIINRLIDVLGQRA